MEYRGLVAGLGNPGPEYAGTRHNCGFMFIKSLLAMARDRGRLEELRGRKFRCELWRVSLPELEGTWLAAMPQTFMNDSGRSVQPLLAWHDMGPDRLVVAHDELDIPPGQLRFKSGGGLAGHNGLRSIAQCLGTQDFCRLRIGIGKPAIKEEMLNWVLGRPSPEDQRKIDRLLPAALETLFVFSTAGQHDAAVFARHAGA